MMTLRPCSQQLARRGVEGARTGAGSRGRCTWARRTAGVAGVAFEDDGVDLGASRRLKVDLPLPGRPTSEDQREPLTAVTWLVGLMALRMRETLISQRCVPCELSL